MLPSSGLAVVLLTDGGPGIELYDAAIGAGHPRSVPTKNEKEHVWTPVAFYSLAEGTPYLHFAVRASRKAFP